MIFYLGTHETSWLGRTDVPLMVSHRRLRARRTIPGGTGPVIIDSGGFSELSLYGWWMTSEQVYGAAIARYVENVGTIAWAAPQDWMCEPWIIAKTGLSVYQHQARTVGNYLRLTSDWPGLPFIPVLQGWTIKDYWDCADLYEQAGVRLADQPVVGAGSVCRRQDTMFAETLFRELYQAGLSCHGFGVKTTGLARYSRYLTSADSLAWSFRARRDAPLPDHPHKACVNCLKYALQWREKVLDRIARPEQLSLLDAQVSRRRTRSNSGRSRAAIPRKEWCFR